MNKCGKHQPGDVMVPTGKRAAVNSENRIPQNRDERPQKDSKEQALKSVLLEDLPIKRLSHKNITIEGYSRAAFQTYWRIPEFRLGFDLGAQPWAFMGTPSWFVSHTHIDHVVALPAYVSRRRMMRMEPPTIYLPEQAVPLVEKLLHVVARLDRGRLPCQLIPAAPGQEFELSRELVVTTVPTQHTVPSLGFIVWERRKKLKPEFHGLPGEKIRDLRLSGVEVTNEIRLPRVAYLGDTRVDVLDEYPDLYRAEVLIMEVTFLSPHHRGEKIRKFGHVHIDDLVARRDRFQNELIIASHFSIRYTPRMIEKLARKAVPDMLGGRLQLWL
ncbi:MBL fold metallo-hydrolase [Thermogutta sp.]|uniref:MBL fold metallo-hydrolase n=1 Tax=Thermogutta sp. TaxID=1962930 RepID=UPI003C7A2F6B